jgi:hypothetical protein
MQQQRQQSSQHQQQQQQQQVREMPIECKVCLPAVSSEALKLFFCL